MLRLSEDLVLAVVDYSFDVGLHLLSFLDFSYRLLHIRAKMLQCQALCRNRLDFNPLNRDLRDDLSRIDLRFCWLKVRRRLCPFLFNLDRFRKDFCCFEQVSLHWGLIDGFSR